MACRTLQQPRRLPEAVLGEGGLRRATLRQSPRLRLFSHRLISSQEAAGVVSSTGERAGGSGRESKSFWFAEPVTPTSVKALRLEPPSLVAQRERFAERDFPRGRKPYGVCSFTAQAAAGRGQDVPTAMPGRHCPQLAPPTINRKVAGLQRNGQLSPGTR